MVNSLFNVLQRLFQVCLFINPLVNIFTTNELKKPVPCRQSQLSSSPFASQTPWKEQNTLLKKTTFSENLGTVRVHTEKLQLFFMDFSRTTLNFQGPPTRNIISQRVHKYTFLVYSNKAFKAWTVCVTNFSTFFSSLVLNW